MWRLNTAVAHSYEYALENCSIALKHNMREQKMLCLLDRISSLQEL